jgi:hypothetical protein
MQKLWCWRCKMEVGMLNEEEYAIAGELYSKGIRSMDGGTMQERFQPLLDYYYKVTGEKETVPNAVMHHRIAQYGPPCENCRKPYRTPTASFCAACGHKRTSEM